MFANPEDIASKPISQHFLEHFILDLLAAPVNRLLILVQTQPSLQNQEPNEKGEKVKHERFRDFVREIYRQEGIAGFWKGCAFDVLKNGVFRVIHSFFFRLYEPLLNVEDASRRGIKAVSLDFLLFWAIEVALSTLQHPLKVIRVRLAVLDTPMDPNAPKGFRKISHCVQKIWNEDGYKGFYRGFGMALVESVVNAFFVTVQKVVAHRYIAQAGEDKSLFESLRGVASERSAGSVISAALSIKSVQKKLRTIVFQLGQYLGKVAILYPFRVLQRRIIMDKDQWKVKQTSVRGVFREIWRKEGLGGLYSGITIQLLLDTGILLASPLIASVATTILPDQMKTMAKVGEINTSVEEKITEITDTATEQVTKIKDTAAEQVTKIKDTATEQVTKIEGKVGETISKGAEITEKTIKDIKGKIAKTEK